jgi:hypothetical protein
MLSVITLNVVMLRVVVPFLPAYAISSKNFWLNIFFSQFLVFFIKLFVQYSVGRSRTTRQCSLGIWNSVVEMKYSPTQKYQQKMT